MLANHVKKLWLIVIILVFGLMSLAVYASSWYERYEFKKAASEKLGTEATAALTDDALRLQLFARELSTAPLFSLSATDLTRFAAVIDALEANQAEFATYYENDDRRFVETALYPISFWRSLHKTEGLRRQVVANPSHESAEVYFKSLQETAMSYQSYLTIIKPVLEESPQRTIGYLDGTVHVDALVAWLTELEKQNEATQQWIATERTCLQEYQTERCAHSLPVLITRKQQLITATTTEEARDFVLHFAETESATANVSFTEPSATEPIGIRGRCSFDDAADSAQLWRGHSNRHALPFLRFTYADELLFRDHQTADAPYSQLLRSRDVPYQFQPINHYLCAQYGYDAAALATLVQLREQTTTDTELVKKDLSALYPELLATLDHHLDFTLHVFAATDHPSVSELLLSQGALSLTLLSFNPTINPNAAFPIESHTVSKEDLHLAQYPEDLAATYPSYANLITYLDHAIATLRTLRVDQAESETTD